MCLDQSSMIRPTTSGDPRLHRHARFVAAVLYFLLSGVWISAISADRLRMPMAVLILYVGYLFLQGGLLVLLSRRLYRQHKMCAVRFDITALMIVTTMTAAPMGALSLLRQLTIQDPSSQSTFFWVLVFLHLVFSVLPLISVCEALSTWWTTLRNRRVS